MNAAYTVAKQVVVVSKTAELTALLNRLLARSNWHVAAASPGKAADSCSLADVMVVDLPLDGRGVAVAEIRRRFSGPLIVIARSGEGWSGLLDEDHGIVLLTRPFAARELSAALGISPTNDPISPQPTSSLTADAAPTGSTDAAAWPNSPTTMAGSAGMTDCSARGSLAMAAFGTRAARRGPSSTWWNRTAADLASFLHDRQRRRFAVGALFLIAFVGAFALAARESCGIGCESLTNGSGVQPTSVTIEAPSGTASPGRQSTGSTANPQASSPDTVRDSVGSLSGVTLSKARRSGATVTQRSGSATTPPTTAPPTTAPPTTAPPTTAPPTTAPPTTAPPTTAPPTTAPTTTAPPDDT